MHTNGSSPPNETSPLLGDRQPVGDPENGVCAGDGADEAVVTREGLPEVAAKMHMLIPAIGIGVSRRA